MADWIALHLDGKGGVERVIRLRHSSNMPKHAAQRMSSVLSTTGLPERVAVIRADRLVDQLFKEGVRLT